MKFNTFLELNFGMLINKNVVFSLSKNSVRVFNKSLMQCNIKGFNGFVAAVRKKGKYILKSEFIQLFGKYANKNIINLNDIQVKYLVNHNKPLNLDYKDGQYILKYGRHVLGIGIIKNKRLFFDFVGKGRKKIMNNIKP